MNIDMKALRAAANACNGWSWPDRKRDEHGVHHFGRRTEGEFYEIGTIDASTYTGEYVDDLRVLKFIRMAQPAVMLELLDRLEHYEAQMLRMAQCAGEFAKDACKAQQPDSERDAARYRSLRKLSVRHEGFALHLSSLTKGRTLDDFADECVADAAMAAQKNDGCYGFQGRPVAECIACGGAGCEEAIWHDEKGGAA